MTKDVESPLNFDFLKLSKARFHSIAKSERKSETINESVPNNDPVTDLLIPTESNQSSKWSIE